MAASNDPFLQHRDRLFGIAYRMLGSVSDAEDVVQEAWLRWQGCDRATIDNPAAYLTRIATSISIDSLRRARQRRENYTGPWLPEPLPGSFAVDAVTVVPAAAGGSGADAGAELAETLSLALLALLETLSPRERATFVLRAAFQMSFDEIGECLDAQPATCRQWFHRARRRLAGVDWEARQPDQERERLERFLTAISAGDPRSVVALLSEDVRLYSDGGGKVVAARRPLYGQRQVSRFLLGVAARGHGRTSVDLVRMNGGWGALIHLDGHVDTVLTLAAATWSTRSTWCATRTTRRLRQRLKAGLRRAAKRRARRPRPVPAKPRRDPLTAAQTRNASNQWPSVHAKRFRPSARKTAPA